MPAIILLLVTMVPAVFAQSQQTEVQQVQNPERCYLAQNYIKNIQKPRDLRARVDRLQAYRYVFQRMEVFTRRLEINNQPQARELRKTLSELDIQIEKFKQDYEKYDQTREDITNIFSCQNNIAKFQLALEKLRTERSQVNKDVNNIKELLNPIMTSQLDILLQSFNDQGVTEKELDE